MDEISRRVVSFALAGTVVAGVPVVAHADNTNTDDVVVEEVVETTNYIVKKGDTLSQIAEQFYGNAAYYPALARYNHIANPSLIYAGQIITIPKNLSMNYYDYNSNEVVIVTPTPETEEEKTYTVKSGDTMYCIVRVQYGLTNQEAVDKLATYNGLSDPNRIYAGQVLRIPSKEKLLQVVQNDYTAEYNRMGWILNHPNGCNPCRPVNPCNGWLPGYPILVPMCPPEPCEPQPQPECDCPCLKLVP